MTNGTSSIPNLDARAGPLVLRTPRQIEDADPPAALRSEQIAHRGCAAMGELEAWQEQGEGSVMAGS